MGKYVAENLVKNLIKADIPVKSAKVAILGFTFKENCPDTRNTKIIDIYNELKEYGITAQVTDDNADADEAKRLYGIEFTPFKDIRDCDAVILAVAHEGYKALKMSDIDALYNGKHAKVLTDLKGILNKKEYVDGGYVYWRL